MTYVGIVLPFRIIFYENTKQAWFCFKEELLTKDNDEGKGYVTMMSHSVAEVKSDEKMMSESNLDLDRIAQHVQNSFKLKNFYVGMDFDAGRGLAIMKEIIELTDSLGGLGSDKKATCRGRRFEDNSMVSTKMIGRFCPIHYRPLYVTAHVHDVELKHALIDPGSSLNIMQLSTLEMVGISRSRIIKQSIKVASFGDNTFFTLG